MSREYDERLLDDSARRRRRRDVVLMIALAVAVVVVFVMQTVTVRLPQVGGYGPTMVFFALLDLNIILIILLLFLILRNVTKLVMERRTGVLGSKLRTKLMVAFVGFALIPTVLLFYVAWTLTAASLDRYLSPTITRALHGSLQLAQQQYRVYERGVQVASSGLARQVESAGLLDDGCENDLLEFVFNAFQNLDVDAVEVYNARTGKVQRFKGLDLSQQIYSENMPHYLELGQPSSALSGSYKGGQLVRGVSLVYETGSQAGPVGVIVLTVHLPQDVYAGMQQVAQAVSNYDQFRLLSQPIRLGYLVILTSISLLILFSASWFGIYLSRGLVVPIQRLAEATDQVAAGNLDVHVELPPDDELAQLVNSFNRMASDLKLSKAQIESTNFDLEQRRHYMETILRSVGAGVIGLDRSGRISLANEAARALLKLEGAQIVGRRYVEVIQAEHVDVIRIMLRDLGRSGQQTLSRQTEIAVHGELKHLLVSVTNLGAEGSVGRAGGTVVVFEDLSELLRAQRMAAWQEVARRIAHEIKNPLTPIQLSAQRLRKRYLERFSADDAVFDECTKMIIDQVGDLKNMVNEFSMFARMADAKPQLTDLRELIAETLVLHQQAHKRIEFQQEHDPRLPLVPVDPDQLRRALINLLDNAVDSIRGEGKIEISTSMLEDGGSVRIAVADDGAGILPQMAGRLFEPYASTKPDGTGLGLAIVKRIVADHNGYIRVRSNEPRGTIVLIELPLGKQTGRA
ncbi:MAG: ATP-binding protein [Candidatus Alcyoniella australis]|nr:ATP-binding protein [Candidatus Alcyoniella australis]